MGLLNSGAVLPNIYSRSSNSTVVVLVPGICTYFNLFRKKQNDTHSPPTTQYLGHIHLYLTWCLHCLRFVLCLSYRAYIHHNSTTYSPSTAHGIVMIVHRIALFMYLWHIFSPRWFCGFGREVQRALCYRNLIKDTWYPGTTVDASCYRSMTERFFVSTVKLP